MSCKAAIEIEKLDRRRRKCGECRAASGRKAALAHYYKLDKAILNARASARRKTDKYKEYRRAYEADRRKNDPIFSLRRSIRIRLNQLLKYNSFNKNKKMDQYLGCSVEFLKQYLESKFKPGMTWEDRKEWHIDHIIPLASADTEEELYNLCHYTNLQPLWAFENMSKCDKITNK